MEDLDWDWESLNFSDRSPPPSAEGEEPKPGNSWILVLGIHHEDPRFLADTTTEEEVEELEHDEEVSLRMTYLFQLLWILTLVGRWPFALSRSKKNGKINVQVKNRWFHHLEAWTLALLLTLLFGLFLFELTSVFSGGEEVPWAREKKSDPNYRKLEQLLLQKH